MNILNLNQFWKPYEDGTEILVFNGVQIASIQPTGISGAEYEVYTYDSDFQGLFQGIAEYPYVSKNELKNKVGNLLVSWLGQLTWALNNPCPNV